MLILHRTYSYSLVRKYTDPLPFHPFYSECNKLGGEERNAFCKKVTFSLSVRKAHHKNIDLILLLFLATYIFFPLCGCEDSKHVFMIERYNNFLNGKNSSDLTSFSQNETRGDAAHPYEDSDDEFPLQFSYGGGIEKNYILENPISIYVIWYGNWRYSGATKDMAILKTFINSLSYESSEFNNNATVNKWWNVVRTYYNPNTGKHVSGSVSIAREIFDRFSFGTDLYQNVVGNIIDGHITRRRLPVDRNGLYLLFVSGEVCYRGVSWFPSNVTEPCNVCFGCAFHGYFERSVKKNAHNLTYAYVANGFSHSTICGSLCMPRYGGNVVTINKNRGIDLMVNLLAHELAEASTNIRAQGEGWSDVRDRRWEIADACQNTFMPEYFTPDLKSKFNLVGKGGMKFLVQRVFHLYRGCTLQANTSEIQRSAASIPLPKSSTRPRKFSKPLLPPKQSERKDDIATRLSSEEELGSRHKWRRSKHN